jgi:hypothetical protein
MHLHKKVKRKERCECEEDRTNRGALHLISKRCRIAFKGVIFYMIKTCYENHNTQTCLLFIHTSGWI